jgi:hypothetical protein
MHLDGYLEYKDQKVAFEYQGRQHREFVNIFHKTVLDFETRLKDDREKKRLCMEHGIQLIIIPDTGHPDELHDFIIRELEKKSISYPRNHVHVKSEVLEKEAYLDYYFS